VLNIQNILFPKDFWKIQVKIFYMRVLLLAQLAVLAFSLSVRADWQYVRTSSSAPAKGTLTTSLRGAKTYVSVRQFCYALGCKTLYQWASQRVVVKSPEGAQRSALLSAVTRVALIDGRVLEFEDSLLSEAAEGYLMPMELASKLAIALQLGRLQETPELKLSKAEKNQIDPGKILKTIIIDPGHGGNDWGTGFGSVYEKDVALIYAFKLRDEVKKLMPDLDVLLTRESDKYVSLPDRAKFANAKGANLFISVHVNHAADPKVEGVETYILSPDATDDEAKRIALLENDSWLKNSKIHEAGDTIRKILVDMEQTKYIQNSAMAASYIQQELTGLEPTRGLRSRGVKQAMFYVLSQVAMPSTLVEIGFISSAGDRSRMMDVVFRDEFIKSVVSALKRYREKLRSPN